MKDCEEHKIADIQHRDIQDSELHELKGAAGAIIGSVPVANGLGATSFQKLGVTNFSGSIPTGVPDLVLATDGLGGFKGSTAASGRVLYTRSGSIETMSASTALTGMFIDDKYLRVTESGLYWYSTSRIYYNPATENTPISINWPNLVDSTGSIIFNGISGVVLLSNTQYYNLTLTGDLSLWKIVV